MTTNAVQEIIVRATAGEAIYAVAHGVENNGKDMSSATFTVALGNVYGTVPTSWNAPDKKDLTSPSAPVISMLVPATTTAGLYWYWVKVVDGSETLFFCIGRVIVR